CARRSARSWRNWTSVHNSRPRHCCTAHASDSCERCLRNHVAVLWILVRMEFTDFDARGYRMVDVRSGYSEWVSTYETTVEDTMDLALLERLAWPEWSSVRRAADLGCGTGRTGAWLHEQGVWAIDG